MEPKIPKNNQLGPSFDAARSNEVDSLSGGNYDAWDNPTILKWIDDFNIGHDVKYIFDKNKFDGSYLEIMKYEVLKDWGIPILQNIKFQREFKILNTKKNKNICTNCLNNNDNNNNSSITRNMTGLTIHQGGDKKRKLSSVYNLNQWMFSSDFDLDQYEFSNCIENGSFGKVELFTKKKK